MINIICQIILYEEDKGDILAFLNGQEGIAFLLLYQI